MAGSSQHRATISDRGVAAAWCALALALFVVMLSLEPSGSAVAAASCEPITFTVDVAAPPFVHAELELAMREVAQRTGLAFERAPGNVKAPKLRVSWAAAEGGGPASAFVSADDEGRRRLAFAAYSWTNRSDGGRQLVDAVIEVDATRAWAQGLDTGDGLAAVFVHELGHVLGLIHSDDPTSFMHHMATPQKRTWTDAEASQLAGVGHQSGCRPDAPT